MSRADPRPDARAETLPSGSQRLRRLRHRALAEASRVGILELLRSRREPLTVNDIADEMGLHPNTARVHLSILVEAGLVVETTAPGGAPGRPARLYEASGLEPDEQSGYRLLASILAGHLSTHSRDPAAAAEAAGSAWGRRLVELPRDGRDGDPLPPVIELLDRLGFEPESHRGERGVSVELHHCPFRDIANDHPEVACAVHLGIIRGALRELGSDAEATLQPFVTPLLCTAELRTRRSRSPATPAARRRARA